MNRETLEQVALETVSATHYYDLADTIQETSTADLYDLITCDGDEVKEQLMFGEEE